MEILAIGVDILKIIEDIYKTAIEENGYTSSVGTSLLSTAKGIAGIAGITYIGSKIAGQILRNEGINFIPLLRPFALVILIAFIPQICNLIDSTFGGLAAVAKADNSSVALRVAELQKTRNEAVKKKWKAIEDNSEEYNRIYGDPSSSVPGIETIVKTFNINIGKLSDDFKSAMYDFTQSILTMLGDVAYIILYLISVIYRVILRVIAPIAIAIAIFDGMNNNFLEWIGKYVNYALLPAIAGIYQNIAVKINSQFLKEMVSSGDLSATLPSQDPFAFGLVYTGVLVILLVLYMQIPSITNMVMVVGGASGMVQGLQSKAGSLASGTGRAGKAGMHGGMMAGGAAIGGAMGAAAGARAGYQTNGLMGAAGGSVVGGGAGAFSGAKVASGMYGSASSAARNFGK